MAPEPISERTEPATSHGSPRGTAEMPVSGPEKIIYGLQVVPCSPKRKIGVTLWRGECDFEVRSYPGSFVLKDPDFLANAFRGLEKVLANDTPFPVRADEPSRPDLARFLVTIEIVNGHPFGMFITAHNLTAWQKRAIIRG
jgi:hypothetical protein